MTVTTTAARGELWLMLVTSADTPYDRAWSADAERLRSVLSEDRDMTSDELRSYASVIEAAMGADGSYARENAQGALKTLKRTGWRADA